MSGCDADQAARHTATMLVLCTEFHGEMGPRSWRRRVPRRPVMDGKPKARRCFLWETWGLEHVNIA
jgi:hypothetical protein